MIKKTLYFSNPCFLRLKDKQLKIEREGEDNVTIPMEDIGIMVLDHVQIQLTHALMMSLVDHNIALISCNAQHLPEGLMLPMQSHHAFTETVRAQVGISEPLRKNLWQQTVSMKIRNQAGLLKKLGQSSEPLLYMAPRVRSGDPDNIEGRAAGQYWKDLFSHLESFKRGRFEEPPNNLLNYGYAILRSVVARSLVGSGMMTFMGIHHKNKYNPYVLADDIMEPYRPYVDELVMQIIEEEDELEILTPAIKKKLLIIPALDIMIDNQKSPLMIAVQRTTASLLRCFEGTERKILYPTMQ